MGFYYREIQYGLEVQDEIYIRTCWMLQNLLMEMATTSV